MITGLIIWIVTVLVVAVLAFVLYKKLSNTARFETRKTEIKWGMISVVMVFVSFLFMPLVCLKVTDEIGDNMSDAIASVFNDEIMDAGASGIRKSTNPKNNTEELSNALDELLKKTGTQDLISDEIKKAAIDNAAGLIYGSNISDPLQYSLEAVAKDLMNNFGIDELAGRFVSDDIQNVALKITSKIAAGVIRSSVPSPLLNIILAPQTKNLSNSAASKAAQNTIKKNGNPVSDSIQKNLSKEVNAFSTKILFSIAIIAALIAAGMLLVIVFMLRTPMEEEFEDYEREHIFQYNNEPLDKINKVRK